MRIPTMIGSVRTFLVFELSLAVPAPWQNDLEFRQLAQIRMHIIATYGLLALFLAHRCTASVTRCSSASSLSTQYGKLRSLSGDLM